VYRDDRVLLDLASFPHLMRDRSSSPSRAMRAPGLVALLLATTFTSAFSSACGPASPPAAAKKSVPTAPTDPPREVATAIASETPWPRTLLATG
jgi:hypothetical protein